MEQVPLDNLVLFGYQISPTIVSGLRIVLIAVLGWIVLALVHKLIRTFRLHLIQNHLEDPEDAKRIATLGRVFRYIASVVIWLVIGIVILGELGISIAPILGAAGVVGLAIGFGAQSLVKDYFTGIFLLLENQLRQGDVVEAGGKSGIVEEVTLRYVQMRDYDGNVHYVPNGGITTVTNMTRGYAQAVVDVGVAYREDVDQALKVMREVGVELRADPFFAPKILEDIEIAGVNEWGDSAVILRCRFKVAPIEQWGVRREYLRRLKYAFDAAGIEIPFPHLTVYAGQLRDGSSPPFNLSQDASAQPSQDAGVQPGGAR
jgi:small-conductance mechanosensitive channel